jgi:transglutaminase-like putative cysteine protease
MSRRDPLAVALRVALAVCAGCGWLAASIVLIENLEPAGSWPRASACLAWLVLTPLYEEKLAAALARLPRVGPRAARLVWVAEVLPVFLLPTPLADAMIFGSMVLAQGHLFLAGEDDRNAARCLAAAPLINVIALAYEPSVALLGLLPLSGLAAFVALVLLGGRATRRRVKRGRPVVEGAGAVGSRIAYALPLGALALGLGALGFVGLTTVMHSADGEDDGGPAQAAVMPARDPMTSGASSRAKRPEGYSPEMAFGSSTLPFSDALVMQVWPAPGTVGGGELHLRDMVMDTFSATGIHLADPRPPRTFADDDDGERDGWSWVRGTSAQPTQGYVVETKRLKLRTQENLTLVFAPNPLAAIALPSVDYSPDKVLYTHEPLPDPFRYGVKVALRDTSPARLKRLGRSSQVARRYLSLPPESASMSAIAELSRDWTAGFGTDYEVVGAVVERLRTRFQYEIRDLGFQGPRALLKFLREERGYCTYFASAAALMLRTRGIPTRVATGFLAHEWQADAGYWTVRERDAHAWLEVAFEDVGWVTFDPTPADAARRGLGAELDGASSDEAPWEERVSAALQRWLGAEGSLGELLGTLLSAPATLVQRVPALWLLPSALVLLLLHLLVRDTRRARWDDGPDGLPARTHGLYQRLARVLAQHGHRRRVGQTPREFARGLDGVGPPALARVGRATELYYGARYGRRPLAEGEQKFVEGLIRDLERSAGERPQNPCPVPE